MKFYDITVPISENTPEWPGDVKYQREERKTSAIVSKLTMSAHFGTHIDAPKHFLFKKKSVDALQLEALVGKYKVFDIKSHNQIVLEDVQKLPIAKNDRILFKTTNSNIVTGHKFNPNYVSLSLEAARFLVNKKIALVGIDYFGIEAKSAPGHPVHTALLSQNIVVVEGLNLQKIKPGIYQGAILPLKIVGADGAPARAVLWK
jgi:arylformamidase